MRIKNIFLFKLILVLIFITSCQTINEKSQSITKKENEKLSKFIGQPISELMIVMGSPDNEAKDEKGSKIFIYKNKKYGISCERRFEINEVDMIVGFSSKGCF
ncbi:hypothetical protein OAJ75_04235 [Candidatus Pelagibacter sp.]|nr:hypothetical protein [Candidatus Pelagibacter sp.]